MEKENYLTLNMNYILEEVKEKKQSIFSFSKKIGVDMGTISDFANGVTENPNMRTLIKISQALNIKLEDLLYKDLRKEKE